MLTLMIKTKRAILVLIITMITACSSNTVEITNGPQELDPIQHTYHALSEEVEAGDFRYSVNSVKLQEGMPSKDGNVWLVVDITFEDTLGNEDGYLEYASMYGDFVLLDEENYFYRGYYREKKTEFYGSARDYVLFMVPESQKKFLLFDDYWWDDSSRLDDESRNIVRIDLTNQ